MTTHTMRRLKNYDDTNQMKRCSRCDVWMPFSSFATACGAKTTKAGISLQSYCRACSKISSKLWAKTNPEAKCQHVKDAYWRDPVKHREKKNNETAEKREIRNANHRAWRKANIGKVLLWNRLRKMKLRVAGPEPRTADVVRMAEDQDLKCVYCRKSLENGFHIDHKTPVSRGGLNDRMNLQLLCAPCNLKKGKKTHEEYLDCLAATIGRLYGSRI